MDIAETIFDPAISDRDKELKSARNSDQEIHPVDDLPEKEKKSKLFFAILETCFIFIGLLCIYFFLPRMIHDDGTQRYQYLADFLHHGITWNPGAKYSLVGPIFALPLLIIGERLGQPVAWILVYNYVLFAGSLLTIYLLCRNHIDRGLLRKFILLLVTSSMFAAHLFAFYGEAFSAVCIGVGIIAFMRRSRLSSIGGWIAVILGVVNTPAMVGGFCLLIFKRMLDMKRLRYLIAVVAVAALILGESWLRRGSPLASGYANDAGFQTVMPYSGLPGFSYPFFFGLISILFSFGKGLIFFTPGFLLPVRKTMLKLQEKYDLNLYQLYVLWLFFLVGLILVYSRWWAWYGGRYWGPRFFLFASLPASLALAVRLHDKGTKLWVNIFTGVVLCLSAWVGVCAALFQSDTYISMCSANNYALEAYCHYVPEFSVLWHPFVVHPHLDFNQGLYLVYLLVVFLYFFVPLLCKIYQQSKGIVVATCKPYLDITKWRI